jgi:hypothetical protein
VRRMHFVALTLPAVVLTLALSASRAEAVTLQEIMQLTRAGVTDEVLLALIEIDQRVFPIDPATLTMLKQAGVSERVIVAIVKSGRTLPPAPAPSPEQVAPPDPPAPQVLVIERERPVIQEVFVPVYVGVPAYPSVRHRNYVQYRTSTNPYAPISPFLRPFPSIAGVPDTPSPVRSQKAAPPQYWGWGGKPRPDGWKQSP